MATLSFEGETHGELVVKVRRWLASLEGEEDGALTPHEVVEQGAELTKEALRIIASAAPEPVAQSELVKALTNAGRHRHLQARADDQILLEILELF